jgi:hypothetical protein
MYYVASVQKIIVRIWNRLGCALMIELIVGLSLLNECMHASPFSLPVLVLGPTFA